MCCKATKAGRTPGTHKSATNAKFEGTEASNPNPESHAETQTTITLGQMCMGHTAHASNALGWQ